MTPEQKEKKIEEIRYKVAHEMWTQHRIDIAVDTSVTLKTKAFMDIIHFTEKLTLSKLNDKYIEKEKIRELFRRYITKDVMVYPRGFLEELDTLVDGLYREMVEELQKMPKQDEPK